MRHVGHVGAGDGCVGHWRQVVRPVEAGAEADRVRVVGTHGVDDLLLQGLPFVPCASACVGCGHCRLVEELIEGDCGFVLVALGDGAPELEGFFFRGVVHGRGIQLILEVADGMPVHDDVQAVFFCPFDALVHGGEGLFPAHGVEVGRMHGETHDVGAPVGGLGEIALVPLPVLHELDRVGEAESAEDDLLPLRVDESVSFHFDPGVRGRTRCCQHEDQRRYDECCQVVLFHDSII